MKLSGELPKNLIPQPGYPKITQEEELFTVQVKYMLSESEMRYLPDIGDAYKESLPLSCDLGKIVLNRITASPKGSSGIWEVDLEYHPEELYDEVTGKGQSRVRKTYELSTEDMDVPIEQHSSYRTCWNHVLLADKNTGSVPSWWGNATGTEVSSEHYKWAKPGDVPPDGWKVIKAETKPGVESFRSGVPSVTVTKTCRKRSQFDEEARDEDYTIGRPGKTFGLSGSWLRGGSSIRRQGRLWELQVTYINSKRIDQDIYHS